MDEDATDREDDTNSEMSVISEVEYAHEGDAEGLNALHLVQQRSKLAEDENPFLSEDQGHSPYSPQLERDPISSRDPLTDNNQ